MNGGSGNDFYEFSSEHNYSDSICTVSDTSGEDSILMGYFTSRNISGPKTIAMFDVDKNGNIVGNDMYLMSADNMPDFDGSTGLPCAGVKVENYFSNGTIGSGCVEDIFFQDTSSKDNPLYEFDRTKLDSLASAAGQAITEYNQDNSTTYNSIGEVFADFFKNGNGLELVEYLFGLFNDDDLWNESTKLDDVYEFSNEDLYDYDQGKYRHIVINDQGGYDSLNFNFEGYTDVYFEVNADGTTGSSLFLNERWQQVLDENGHITNGVEIQNYFGDGKIEEICQSNNWFDSSRIDQVISEVSAFLTDKGYASTSEVFAEAMNSGNLDNAFALRQIYEDNMTFGFEQIAC